jgi:branched-subunit amino acid ABC-type transport system permease component
MVRSVKDYLPFIVVGVTAGSLYGLAGMGLVLTYKTSGIFNFAHGAIAAAAAFVFYELHVEHTVPWPLALLNSLVLIGVIGGFLMERFASALADVRPVLSIAGTIGLLLMVQGLLNWRYGFATRQFDAFLPAGGLTVSGVLVQWQQVFAVVVALVAAIGLYLLFRVTAIGAAMRAVVDDAELLDLSGTNPRTVRTIAWMIGCSFAALTGILIAPSLGLDAALLTLLVVQAFGAIAVGRFKSLPLTYAGGVLIGVAAAVLTKQVAGTPSLAGLPSSVPFLVLFAVLLIRPPQRIEVARLRRRVSSTRTPQKWQMAAALGAVALAFAVVPSIVGAKLPVYTNAMVLIPALLSLGMLIWLSGQISLCHAAFVAIGASTMGHLAGSAGMPWPVALVCCGLAAVPVGVIVALPAIRLSGVYLALATFGFGILMEQVVFGQGIMFGAFGLRQAPRPSFGRTDESYYFVTLVVAALCCLIVAGVARSRLGRLLRALGDSPTALSTTGVAVSTTRVLAFALAAFLAGVTGGLSISSTGQAAGRAFGFSNSLLWLAVLVVCGSSVVRGAVLSALLISVAPAYAPDALVPYQPLIFGTVAVIASVAYDGVIRRSVPSSDRARRSPVRARTITARPQTAPGATT